MRWIYFALIDGENISIGSTDNVPRRIRQHAKTKHDVHEVKLLVAVQGNATCEKHVQRYFYDDLVPGGFTEYFHATPRLTNYIRWLRNQWFASVHEDDLMVDGSAAFDVWGPSVDRETPPPRYELFSPDWLEFNDRIVTGDDYYTNPLVLGKVRDVLGRIDLDPASHPLANRHVKASRIYTIQDDGVSHPWRGRVWLNPPFSEWKRWVPKIIEELRGGQVEAMLVYSAMRTLTAKYYRSLLDEADAMCVITGRLQHGGKGGDSPDDGHAVFAFRCDTRKFAQSFGELGVVWVKP